MTIPKPHAVAVSLQLIIAVAALVAVAWAPAARAQTGDEELQKQIDALKQGQEEILRQLAEIKKQLAARPVEAPPARPAGPNVRDRVFDLGANLVRGESTAPLTVVEFTDYQ